MSFSKIDSKTFDDGKNKEGLTTTSLGQFASSVDNTPSNEVDFKVLDKEKKEALTKEALKDFDSTKLNMLFTKSSWSTLEDAYKTKSIHVNGRGSYMILPFGPNGSKYDAWFVRAKKPPCERHLIVSKFNEVVCIDGKEYNLSTNIAGGCVQDGMKYLQTVEVGPITTFTYKVGSALIQRKMCMVYGKDAISVVYSIKNGDKPVTLKLYPVLNDKDFHSNSYCNNMNFKTEAVENGFIVNSGSNTKIHIKTSDGEITKKDMMYYNMQYPQDAEKGLASSDDHYMPGYITIGVGANAKKDITVLCTTDNTEMMDGNEIIKKEIKRCNDILKDAGYDDEILQMLELAMDKFYSYRESTGGMTLMAGNPWFLDWGRDAGVGSIKDKHAKEIISSFAQYLHKGLTPNMFPNLGEKPIYNTADGSLWLIESVSKYLESTKNKYEGHKFIKDEIYPKLKEIIYWYNKGTDFDIKNNDDGLISCGPQVTWMDAKIGDWVVTPRDGKPVEINALWYNALKVMEDLAQKYGDNPTMYREMAAKAKKSFSKYWNEETQCLYDVIKDDNKDASIRPNQVFALSLTHSPIDKEMGKKILAKVYEELYATLGLRSLSPNDKKYSGKYKGDPDYHQGTGWPWLLGPYIGAYLKVYDYSKEAKEFGLELLKPLIAHLRVGGLGSICEIFDGDSPNAPKGCFSQLWSVTEIKRAIKAVKGIEEY